MQKVMFGGANDLGNFFARKNKFGFKMHRVLLGSGMPLFREMSRQIDLELVENRPMKYGCMYVHYKVKK